MTKKILKIIGIILIILIVLLLIHATRNFIIISKLQDNILEYKDSTNFHVSMKSKEPNEITIITNYYKKDNKEVLVLERKANEDKSKITVYNNNGKRNMYIETAEGKTAKLDIDDMLMNIQIYNSLETETKVQAFLFGIFTYIRSEDDCYRIGNFQTYETLSSEGKNEFYIEKETGLIRKTITNDMISEREYEFNNVDDSIFIEPNINEYEIEGKVSEEFDQENDEEAHQEVIDTSEDVSNKEENFEVLAYYTSADRNAMLGDPITVEIYEMNDEEFKFKYHAIWNDTDIEGIAKKQENLYIYEYDNKKIEFLFNSFGENSLGVKEYENNDLSSTINLFK